MAPPDRGRGPPANQNARNTTVFNTKDAARAREAARLRRQQHARQAHALGERVWFEFVDELCRYHPQLEVDIDARLAAYAGIDRRLLLATGGHQFPARPLWRVP
jgi:hypothetical protein